MSKDERIKLVIDFTCFLNNHMSLFESMYNLFKNGESELVLKDSKINLKAVDFNEEKSKDTFFTTVLFMYISMKQLQNMEDEYVVISEDEMLEVANYIEFARVLPEFKKFVKEINNG